MLWEDDDDEDELELDNGDEDVDHHQHPVVLQRRYPGGENRLSTEGKGKGRDTNETRRKGKSWKVGSEHEEGVRLIGEDQDYDDEILDEESGGESGVVRLSMNGGNSIGKGPTDGDRGKDDDDFGDWEGIETRVRRR